MPVTHDSIDLLSRRIAEELHPERIILFGSHARGDDDEASDVDIMVITSDPFTAANSRRQTLARLSRSLARFRFPLDLLLFSADEVAAWGETTNHVIARALREGKVLYERP